MSDTSEVKKLLSLTPNSMMPSLGEQNWEDSAIWPFYQDVIKDYFNEISLKELFNLEDGLKDPDLNFLKRYTAGLREERYGALFDDLSNVNAYIDQYDNENPETISDITQLKGIISQSNQVDIRVDLLCNLDQWKSAMLLHCTKMGLEITPYLADGDINVDFQDKSTQQTPLLYAANRRDIGQIEQLIGAGADVNAVDYEGNNALLVILSDRYLNEEGQKEAIELLLEKGINPNCVNKYYNGADT